MPLLAGAGVVGLAVGFGAQNLIRDVISGAFLSSKTRWELGTSSASMALGGGVMEINLRTTVLRDFEGVVHVFPNGTISTLSNRTRTFSHYVFDVGVAYKEDPDRVMQVLRTWARIWSKTQTGRIRSWSHLKCLVSTGSRLSDRHQDARQDRRGKAVGRRTRNEPPNQETIRRGGDRDSVPHRTVLLADSTRTPPLVLDDSARAEIRQIVREEVADAATR